MQLGWISQYPHEAECLFAPLTGLEVQSTRIDGAVLVIEARLSINLNALTIEQACRGGVRRCCGRVDLTRVHLIGRWSESGRSC